jgi:uncharacterized protein YegP (UPF0339 family)
MLRVSMSGGNAVRDSRLDTAQEHLEEAHKLLDAISQEGPNDYATLRDFNFVDAAKRFADSAHVYIERAKTTTPPDLSA